MDHDRDDTIPKDALAEQPLRHGSGDYDSDDGYADEDDELGDELTADDYTDDDYVEDEGGEEALAAATADDAEAAPPAAGPRFSGRLRAARERLPQYLWPLAPAAIAAARLPRRLRSWRYFKTSVVVTAVAAVFLVAAAPLTSRDYRTNLELKSMRRTVDHAQRKLAVSAPVEEKKLRPLIAEAERLTLAEKVRGNGYQGRPAADAWGQAFDQARRAVGTVRDVEEKAAKRWKELSPKAKLAVEKSRKLVATTPGMARSSTRNLERAQSQWATAQSFAAKGRFDKAVEAATIVLEATDHIQDRWDSIHDRYDEPGHLRQWRAWTDATIAESRQRTTVLIDKLKRRLTVYKDGKEVATFRAELGSRGLERKLHSGDKATPEGRYKVVAVKDHGQSKYYRAFLLNYPNGEDQARFNSAKKKGQVPVRAGIGSLIEIHGDGGQGKDWTDGCVAVTNQEMDRLFRWVGHGTPVTIVGTVPEGRRGS
jgi:hypothetical protein